MVLTIVFAASTIRLTICLTLPTIPQFINDSGCGNDLRTAHPAVRQLVTDSLRYWAYTLNVDGFRFDLASILTRDENGALSLDPPVISEISSDPRLSSLRLIAEAWDPAAYELGRGFPGLTWRQWNGKFRDDVRSFVKGDSATVPALMTRMYGSSDLFYDDRDTQYRPYQSLNFIDCHDGLCLYDLVAYNNDGQHSWNCIGPGDSEDFAHGRHAAQATGQEFLHPPDARQWHADVLCGRRVHAYPERQRQSVQRRRPDGMAQLGSTDANQEVFPLFQIL